MIGMQERWQEDLFIAGPLSDLIPEDHVLRRIDRVLDLSWLREEVGDCYDEAQGRPGIDPESAVRLMLGGLCQGIVHDRHLMREAQVNLAIRWFAGYRVRERLPDHSSLTRLRQRWGAERFRRIFQRTVWQCVEAGLVGGTLVHMDATLIRADVSWESMVERHVARVLETNDGPDETPPPKKQSTTDPEATLATSNRHQKAEPCYKQHTAVDDRAGVVVDVRTTTGATNESGVILEQVERVQVNTGRRVERVTADAGYAYGKIYRGLEERGVDPVIPPKVEPRPRASIPLAQFKYDGRHQIVRCPRGRILRRSSRSEGRWYYRSRPSDCCSCPLRERCISPGAHHRRTMAVSDEITMRCSGLAGASAATMTTSARCTDGIDGAPKARTRRPRPGTASDGRSVEAWPTSRFRFISWQR